MNKRQEDTVAEIISYILNPREDTIHLFDDGSFCEQIYLLAQHSNCITHPIKGQRKWGVPCEAARVPKTQLDAVDTMIAECDVIFLIVKTTWGEPLAKDWLRHCAKTALAKGKDVVLIDNRGHSQKLSPFYVYAELKTRRQVETGWHHLKGV